MGIDAESYVRGYIAKCRSLGYTDAEIEETLVKHDIAQSLVSRLLQERGSSSSLRGAGFRSLGQSQPFYYSFWFISLFVVFVLSIVVGGYFIFLSGSSGDRDDSSLTTPPPLEEPEEKTGVSEDSSEGEEGVVCGDGVCVSGESCTEDCGECTTDAECDSGYGCVDGECIEEAEEGDTSDSTTETYPNYIVDSVTLDSLNTTNATFLVTVSNTGDEDVDSSVILFCGLYDTSAWTEWGSMEVTVAALAVGNSSEEVCTVDSSTLYASLGASDSVDVDFFVWIDGDETLVESSEEDNTYDYTSTWTMSSFSTDVACTEDGECGAYLCDTTNGICYEGCTDSSACASGYACDSTSLCSSDSDGDGVADSDEITTIESCVEADCTALGYTCDSSTDACYESCTDSSACASGYACDSTSLCSSDSDGDNVADGDEDLALGESCTSDTLCASGHCDASGVCVECEADGDCDSDETCESGSCVASSTCTDDALPTCADGEDNDGDGYIDYWEEVDEDCSSWEDTEDELAVIPLSYSSGSSSEDDSLIDSENEGDSSSDSKSDSSSSDSGSEDSSSRLTGFEGRSSGVSKDVEFSQEVLPDEGDSLRTFERSEVGSIGELRNTVGVSGGDSGTSPAEGEDSSQQERSALSRKSEDAGTIQFASEEEQGFWGRFFAWLIFWR